MEIISNIGVACLALFVILGLIALRSGSYRLAAVRINKSCLVVVLAIAFSMPALAAAVGAEGSAVSAKQHVTLGHKYRDAGQSSQAAAEFALAIAADPKSASALLGLGLAHFDVKNYAAAIDAFSSAIKIDPNWAFLYGSRGVAYEKTGNFESALADLKKMLELNPSERDKNDALVAIKRIEQVRPRAAPPASSMPQSSPEISDSSFRIIPGKCTSATVLNRSEQRPCVVRYGKISDADAFFVLITDSGTTRSLSDDDVGLYFMGYPTGLVGGLDPLRLDGKVLYGLITGPAFDSNPLELRQRGEYFFVVRGSAVIQNRELSAATRAPGHCKGLRGSNGMWSLDCVSYVNPSLVNQFRFVSSEPIPVSAN